MLSIGRSLALLAAFAGSEAAAQILYLGQDTAGKVTISNTAPAASAPATTDEANKQAPRSSPVPPNRKVNPRTLPSAELKAQASRGQRVQGQLVLYAAAWCPHCVRAVDFLNERQIAYTLVDIETPEGRSDFALVGEGKGIPLLVDGERKARGFSPGYYDSFLKKRRQN